MASIGSATEHLVDLSTLRLHYVDWGNAQSPPLLLVHGHSGTAHFWDYVAPAFSDRFHVVALTLRGRGRSDYAPKGRYQVEDYAADLWELTQKLEVDRLVYVGASLGGLIGQWYAVAHPEQVEKLVMVDISGQVGDAQSPATPAQSLDDPEEFDSLQEAEACLRRRSLFARVNETAMQVMLQEGFKRTPNGAWTWTLDRWLQEERTRLGNYGFFPRVWEEAAGIRCPTLIVRGGDSEVLTPTLLRRSQETIPNCQAVEIPGCGHFPYLEKPQEFIQALQQFVG